VTGGGAHGFIVLSDHVIPYANAVRMTRTRGTVVCVSMPFGGEIREKVVDAVTRGITVKGVYGGSRGDMKEILSKLESGEIMPKFTVLGLSDLPKVFAEMERGEVVGRYVLDTSR